jgi:hypothetical protein
MSTEYEEYHKKMMQLYNSAPINVRNQEKNLPHNTRREGMGQNTKRKP